MIKMLLTVSIVLFSVTNSFASEGVINVSSTFDAKETADRLEKILNQKGMTIFNRIPHSDGAAKVGIELRQTELFIFGNPKVGSPLMKCQQIVALDLPQKILIWEDGNSKVWLSYNDPGYLVKRHGISGCEETVATIEKALAGITKAASSR